MAPLPKRPLLPQDDRNRLRTLAANAALNGAEGPSRAYAQGVVDTLRWIVGDDSEMSPMMRDVTR